MGIQGELVKLQKENSTLKAEMQKMIKRIAELQGDPIEAEENNSKEEPNG